MMTSPSEPPRTAGQPAEGTPAVRVTAALRADIATGLAGAHPA